MAKNSKRQRENAENKLKCAVLYLDSVAFSLIPIPFTKPPSLPPPFGKRPYFLCFFLQPSLKAEKIIFSKGRGPKRGEK